MNINRMLRVSTGLMLLMLLAGNASAQVDEAASGAATEAVASPLQQGAYLAPLASYIISDKSSLLDDGFGGLALLGYRNHFWAMEIGGVLSRVSTSASSATLRGAVINGLVFPFAGLPGLYGIVSVGGLEVLDYPNHDGSFSLTTLAGGGGYLWPLSIGNYEFAIRSEAQYRHGKRDRRINASRTDIDAPQSFDDVVLNIGLQLPLSMKAPPPPPPEPVKVVELAPVPAAPADSDGDGVVDTMDQCPETPAGTKVDASGCPLPICKAPMAGERITLAGCGAGDTITLNGVSFEFNQARLTPNAKAILDNVGDELKTHPGLDVELGGHTDSIGADAYNQILSQKRAQSVLEYLSQAGIDESRLKAVGYGESQPVADNETDEGRELNRRVELKVLSSDAAVELSTPEAAVSPAEAASENDVVPVEGPASDAAAVVSR